MMEEEGINFRSVLPHEALPTNEEYGYVNIQGGFIPKVVVHDESKTTTNSKESKTESYDDESVIAGTPPSPPSIDTLKKYIMKTFQGESNESTILKLPHFNIISIEVDVDTRTNQKKDTLSSSLSVSFTKARLCYPSPSIARDIVSFIRHYKITPFMIFHCRHENDHEESTRQKNDHDDVVTFQYSSKAIQATQVTRNPLPPSSIAWPKVGPPKFRRLLPNPNYTVEENEKLRSEREQTRFLFMTNITNGKEDDDNFNNGTIDDYECIMNPCLIQDAIRNALQPFCTSPESLHYPIEIYVNKTPSSSTSNAPFKYCYIGARSTQDVQSLLHHLQGQTIELHIPLRNHNGDIGKKVKTITTGQLFLDHAAITQRCEAKLRYHDSKGNGGGSEEKSLKGEPTRPECTSTTKDVKVPGLVIIPEYLSTDEEEAMFAVLKGPDAPWAPLQSNFSKTGSVKRRVQHYGYVFDYETANVLRDREDKGCCPPMPALSTNETNDAWSLEELNKFSSNAVDEGRGWDVLAATIERVRNHEFCTEGDTLLKFPSLNQMTVNEYKRGQGIGSHVDTESAFSDGLLSLSLGADCVMEFKEQSTGLRKLVHLPPRSLLLMAGQARYLWEHTIVSRGTDFVNGKVIPRNTRISLTLRTAITLPNENGDTLPLQLVQSNVYPPRWGELENEKDSSEITTPVTEKQHVHAVYDAIAKQWHHTRGKRGCLWPGATSFLKSLPQGSIVADVGCGDGKYFPAIWEAGSFVIGTDISLPLLETSVGACISKGQEGPENRHVSKQNSSFNTRPAVAVGDCMNVPLRSDSCDAAICIAVMHHLSTRPRRIRCLEELARIVKKGGTVNIQAWAFEQESNSKRKFAGTDVFVPFNSQPRYLDKVAHEAKKKGSSKDKKNTNHTTSVAEMYSEAYDGAEYDDKKGLVVFQRYCHMYREGELEKLVGEIDNLEVLESGFETGNHFAICKVV